MNKCKRCKYYGEYNDNKFSPLPVCTLSSNLGVASAMIKNSDSCTYYDPTPKTDVAKVFIEMGNKLKEFSNTIKKFEKEVRK